ncbi:DNA polymerase/3'-5' exonuclease PolX [Candidatus Marsarchaeota archaeon]|nr:DNA polymerase/3'-5' exonuclease PolX [Candidatus Marsarchaeota archaeon]MCL5099674.1 DNA polymerase/3'-5' exonuclease PolX [Candidatus Marsarchaeota archaeon]
MRNKELAEIFDEIAAMLSIEETKTSRFEVRAYQTAALNISGLQEDIEDIYRRGGTKALMELPGVGKGIAGHIEEYLKTGHIRKYDALKKKYPVDFKSLTKLEGMGAKKAMLLYRKLKIRDLADLQKAVAAHKVRELEGFGEKSEQSIANGIRLLEAAGTRMPLGEALPEAESIVKALLGSRLVEDALVAGSARRMRETVGDIDILALSRKGEPVMDFFEKLPMVMGTVSKGPTRTTVQLKIGLTCDLRVIKPESFGAAVQYFTGSKAHNIATRKIAIAKGYKLNEYGLFRKNRIIASRDEREIYAKLGMEWVPPEMREDRGEIKLALEHRLPKLVELGDLQGDLHTHTKETDGNNTLEEMADAAVKAGLKYIATTNHTKSLRVARGMDEKGFAKFFEQVDRLNDKYNGSFTIMKGAEVDILKDGSLDLERKALMSMDCVVGGVHSAFNMPEREMTKRIVTAMDSGLMHILAHPTGRVIGVREAYPLDLAAVAEAAERNGVMLEINAYPLRLDLNDTNILSTSKRNVTFAINSDGHNVTHYSVLRYGIGTARRGWLGKERVANALPLEKLRRLLKK